MLGSDRVFQDLGLMLWSSGDELDDEDVLTYLFIIPLCMVTGYYNCLTLMYIVYSDDCKYINYSDSFV